MVLGVTQLDNVLYVVSSANIRTFTADTLRPRVNINVKGMEHPRDIVVCRDDRQLYVADCRCIWRVSVSDHTYVKWLSIESTTDRFDVDALSVTSRRLLVTSPWSRRLRQYSTTDRQLLRVVELPQYVSQVNHGVETTRGTFVVGHQGTCTFVVGHQGTTSQYEWQPARVSELFSFVLCSDESENLYTQFACLFSTTTCQRLQFNIKLVHLAYCFKSL